MGINVFRRSKLAILPVLAIGLAVGGVGYAYFQPNTDKPANHQPNVKTTMPSTLSDQSVKDKDPVPATTSAPTLSSTEHTDPCAKTTSANISNTAPGSTNEVRSEVHCEVRDSDGSSTVNVTNNVSQSAQSGSSSSSNGSGSVSNSSSSNINIDVR